MVVATAITAGVGQQPMGCPICTRLVKRSNSDQKEIFIPRQESYQRYSFMGNDKLYHDVGNVFVTTSAIMIPIGQTQSVVKGVTQFAIGEAGAYTAGQTAYHVTKLAGGSEEDAQTANFIGNILGGYTASSVANKFSLNKVKDTFLRNTKKIHSK